MKMNGSFHYDDVKNEGVDVDVVYNNYQHNCIAVSTIKIRIQCVHVIKIPWVLDKQLADEVFCFCRKVGNSVAKTPFSILGLM